MIKDIGYLINHNNCYLLENIISLYQNIVIEIGSGNGEYIVNLASKKRDYLFLGIELKFKRIFKSLKKINRADIDNIILVKGEASTIIDFFIEDNSIDFFIINFPDPWFKIKHNSRRLINLSFYHLLYQKLKNKGKVFIATDDLNYSNVILDDAKSSRLFKNVDFCDKWLDVENYTLYEKKFLNEGKNISYLELTKY